MNPLDYTQIGYSEFLTSVPENTNTLSSLAFNNLTEDISGSKIQGGVMQTNDGKTQLNLEQGYFLVNGDVVSVRLGTQEDGTVGIVIKDVDGNELIRFTGDQNILKSSDGNVELNFEEAQFLVKDNGNPVILLGKQIGGF